MTAYVTCESNVPSHACENTHVISEIHPYNFPFLPCMGAKGSGRKGKREEGCSVEEWKAAFLTDLFSASVMAPGGILVN